MTDKTKLVAITNRRHERSGMHSSSWRFRRYDTARSQLRVTRVRSARCAVTVLTPFPVTAVDVSVMLMGRMDPLKRRRSLHFIVRLSSVNSSSGSHICPTLLMKALVSGMAGAENEKKIVTGQALPFLTSDCNIFAGRRSKPTTWETYGTLQRYGLVWTLPRKTWKFEGLKPATERKMHTSCYLLDVMRTKTSLSVTDISASPQRSQHVRRSIETVEYTIPKPSDRFLFQP